MIDASSNYAAEQETVVLEQLKALGMDTIPHLFVYNKADLVDDNPKILFNQPSVFISAQDEDDLMTLLDAIITEMKQSYDRLEMVVQPGEINQWIKDSDVLYIESMTFDEEKNAYDLIFYKPKTYVIK